MNKKNSQPVKPMQKPVSTGRGPTYGERGFQPSGPPQGGHRPTTGENAPSSPPSRGTGGKK